MAKFKAPPRTPDEFIEGAQIREERDQWGRPDVTKAFNLRLPESELKKLHYVVKHSTCKSANEYILAVLLPKIEADLKEITGGL